MKSVLVSALFLVAISIRADEAGIRIRFGLTDKSATPWDGTVAVAPGKIDSISGWRFQQRDEVTGATGWKASTRSLTVRRSNNAQRAARRNAQSAAGGPMADNGVVLHLVGVTEDSVVTVKTAQGNFDFTLREVPYGTVVEKLNGAVDIERTAATGRLTTQRTDDDFPSIAVAQDGTVYAVYVSFTPGLDRDERARTWSKEPDSYAFLATPPGGDQLWLRVRKGNSWSEPVAVTAGRGDIYKTSTALDGNGRLWIFWSENKRWGEKGAIANFEIWARSFKDGKLSEPANISNDAGNDVSAVAATDSQGRVWVAWQGARESVFRILAKRQTGHVWSEEIRVSNHKGSGWAPAIAGSRTGRVAIAWDTYEKGDYDIWVREFDVNGKEQPARPVANTPNYEARPAITYDAQNRLWISWELSGPTWGKDWGALERESGIGLYRDRQIGMSVLADGNWMDPAGSFASALPGAMRRRGPANLPVRRPEPEATARRAGQEAAVTPAKSYNNLARVIADRDGRIWLFARSREGNFHTPLGSVWMNYAAYYNGKQWVGPILLPHSDNLLYNHPAVTAHPDGGLILAHSSDHRQARHVQRAGAGSNASLDSDQDPFDNDIYVSRIEFAASQVVPSLQPAERMPEPNAAPSGDALKERDDVARARAFRIDYNGTKLQIVRGEFHRHTEISGDGGNDGPVEDMWRYGIDVAAMDWLGCGDHDNGNGREYTWWLTQKTTDAFHLPGRFAPPFTYERSVRYPEGHRNVVFSYRGVRTLPRLPISNRDIHRPAPDTQMLYKYLRHFDGVCASHTSATSMGTDWRDWDPVVEPFVEIYQGARQNYERPGAPRAPTANDAIGGWEPLGFINLALQKGYRMSFQSSSDHGSTHISYALVYAENTSREALLTAMKQRHTYAATDNIVADYRCRADGKDYMMGDEFTSSQAPTLRIKLIGTAPFKKVTLVKDDVEIPLGEPNRAETEYTWTDPTPVSGKTSYYYVRAEQSDGELVWASPMWITYKPK